MGESVNGRDEARISDQSIEEFNRYSDDLAVFESREQYDSSSAKQLDGYKSLVVWQVSMDLLVECYRLTSHFPKSEEFGLAQQLRRAAVSVTLNIAEWWGRNSRNELARFCDIARGSLHEVDAALEAAIRLGFIDRDECRDANSLFRRTGTMLLRLIRSVRP